jgi:hypothetical protein
VAEEVAIPTIPIPQRHPLFGLWEGSFKVSSPKGDEEIAETFFICCFNGERGDDSPEHPLQRASAEGSAPTETCNEPILPEQFSDLPPDPRVVPPLSSSPQLRSGPSPTSEPCRLNPLTKAVAAKRRKLRLNLKRKEKVRPFICSSSFSSHHCPL